MLHIYTGDGKGKTTAATGLLIRALGSGKKCGYCTFLKDGSSSELEVLKKLDKLIVFDSPEKMKFLWHMTEEEKEDLKKFYCENMKKILESDLELLVLDEATDAVCAGILDEECIVELSQKAEVIVTGRGDCKKLFEIADYITEVKKIKHPFDKGVKARKGIEY